jgi:sec-independent protein translocase protein TatA
MSPILAFLDSPVQLFVVAVIALLIFGKRLPEVMRGLGKGITEFKKGMSGIEDEINRGSSYSPPNYHEPSRPLPIEDQRQEMTAPKFQPPTSAPTEATAQMANPAANSAANPATNPVNNPAAS